MAEPASSDETSPSESHSYFVRLGKLSAKVQERALQHSLVRARHARESAYSAATQITSTLDLLEKARSGLGTASNQIGGASEQLLQRWTEWKQKQAGAGQNESEADGSKDEAEVREVHLETDLMVSNQIIFAFQSIYSVYTVHYNLK